MIQIRTSKALTVDLMGQIMETAHDPRAMQWYAHRVYVLRRKCVIVMEAQSRYAMVFAALEKPDFQRFQDIFRDRIIREALSICQLEDEMGQLGTLALTVSESVQLLPGYDRSVQAHINEVARELNWMARDIGRLPADDGEEFSFGLRVNQTPRQRKGDKDFFLPLDELRAFWRGLLAHVTNEGRP